MPINAPRSFRMSCNQRNAIVAKDASQCSAPQKQGDLQKQSRVLFIRLTAFVFARKLKTVATVRVHIRTFQTCKIVTKQHKVQKQIKTYDCKHNQAMLVFLLEMLNKTAMVTVLLKYCAAPFVFVSTWLLIRSITKCAGCAGAESLNAMNWPWLSEIWMYVLINISYIAALLFSYCWQLDAHARHCNLLTSSVVFVILWALENLESAVWMSLTYAVLPSYLGWYGKRKSTGTDEKDQPQENKAIKAAKPEYMPVVYHRKQKLNIEQAADLTGTIFNAVQKLEKEFLQDPGHSPMNLDFQIVEAWRHNKITHARVMCILEKENLKEEGITSIRLDN
eukprot:12398733-Karenia_brevis.AAC.1